MESIVRRSGRTRWALISSSFFFYSQPSQLRSNKSSYIINRLIGVWSMESKKKWKNEVGFELALSSFIYFSHLLVADTVSI